jgi:hypothetical protein
VRESGCSGVGDTCTASRRRELHEPFRVRPGQEGLVCSCRCVRPVHTGGGGGGSLQRVCLHVASRSRLALFDPVGPVSFVTVRRRWCLQGRGGMWWWAASMVEHDGAFGAGLRGSEEIPCRLSWHRRGDARGRHASYLPEGRWVKPSSLGPARNGETLGSIQAAASSSWHPFLEMLLGTRCFRVIGAWWKYPEGATAARYLRFH